MSIVKRGNIIKVPDTSPGLIACDGKQVSFTLEGVWIASVAPALNQKVDITFADDDTLSSVNVVSQETLAREKFDALKKKTVAGAGELASHAKPLLTQVPNIKPRIKFTKPVIGAIAAVLLLGAWFIFKGNGAPSPSEVENLYFSQAEKNVGANMLLGMIAPGKKEEIMNRMRSEMKFENISCKAVKDFDNYWDCAINVVTPDHDTSTETMRVSRDDKGQLIYIKDIN